MTRVYDLLIAGGPVMWPLLLLSAMTLATGIERVIFWARLLTREDRIVQEVLAAARYNLEDAKAIADSARDLPIGRFLLAPLQLRDPSPETFGLAMEAAGDREFLQMRRGDKLLETTIAIAPLLGLLGTVTGLIATFSNLEIGGGSGTAGASAAAAGIAEALLTTAFGMIVAIAALAIFRVMVTFQDGQVDYFGDVGTRLELIYRQYWYEPGRSRSAVDQAPTTTDEPTPRSP
ncbi:MAG: MotA/TolQ/ExbB proton channel family protein [Oscillatoriales cyanobacterium]|nr:MAG: MotA/TolQ/ExbB proton channel family protein [Oscillatoriales cyanobacterium]